MNEKPGDLRRHGGASVMSYSTRFPLEESPISEGGRWINGRTDGRDWIDIITSSGAAYGAVSRPGVPERRVEQGNLLSGDLHPEGHYDDPTALLTGTWGRNQHGRARVFSRNQTEDYFQEVEIRLRSAMAPHLCTGYEVFFRCLKTEHAYAEIVRWNGRVQDFTSLRKNIGAEFGVKDGDIVEATIFGNVITGFVNGVEVVSATDDTFATGNPGMGFNFGVGATNVDFGFTSFAVESYDD